MSALQLGLLAIGVVVVIAVLAYNKWQESKYRREAERSLGAQHDDALMEGKANRREAARPASVARSAGAGGDGRIEPTFDIPAGDAPPPATAATGPAGLSETIDYIVPIEASENIDGELLINAAASALAQSPKSVRIEGFNEAKSRWESLQHGTRYALMRAGMQLVDRSGPASDTELATFGAGVQQAASASGALAMVPNSGEATVRAEELDKFCGQVDILIAMHVVSSGAPFAGTKIRALAEANGLRLDEDGRFRRRDDEGRVLYEVASMDAIPLRADTLRSTSVAGLTLELDVARTPDPVRAFEYFRDMARKLAQAFDAGIVDEKRAPVSQAAFDQVSAQIQTVEHTMMARSIPPGSPEALRLFS